MNILIDINHPCHVHVFKNLIARLRLKGHNVFVTVKEIPSAIYLLDKYQIEYTLIRSRSDTIIGKAISGISQNFQMLSFVRNNKIDLGIGSSMNIAHLSRVTKMRSIVIDDDDDEVEPLFVKFVHPFADTVLSPVSVRKHRKTTNAVFYSSYHELAYLHPNVFTPSSTILSKLGVKQGDKYFILRFNAFKAHHDVNEHGLSTDQKRILITILEKYGKIFITTERDIDAEFKQYQMKIDPVDIHDALYYATMFIGDSQTMASEAAVLGTPSIRCNTFVRRISYLDEQEDEYGLTYGFKPENFDNLLMKIEELLNTESLKTGWQEKRAKMLMDKIDFTQFLCNFVERYPESYKELKETNLIKSENRLKGE